MALKHPPHLNFKGYLVSKGIRQKEVAVLLGITKATLSKKINGYAHFNWQEVQRICNEYDTKPDIFLT